MAFHLQVNVTDASGGVNAAYVCENNFTENTILRTRSTKPFLGWVCSDYDGTRSSIDAANHGLDIAMPGPSGKGKGRPDYFGAPLRAALKSGKVTEATITEKAVRIVYSLAAVGALDAHNNNSSDTDVTSDAHRALARKLAARSAIMLTNVNSALPLDFATLGAKKASVALIGLAGRDAPLFGGGGSGSVIPKAPVTIFDALNAALGGSSAGGACGVVKQDTDLFAAKGASSPEKAQNGTAAGCCATCSNSSKWSSYTFRPGTGTGTGTVLKPNHDCWCHPADTTVRHTKGFLSGTCGSSASALVYESGVDEAAAVSAAKGADIAIVVIAQTSHEGADRGVNITLVQSELVDTIAKANKNTIVVAISPGPFLTPWRGSVAAIVDFGFSGEQEGLAVVDVLGGQVNPGGKLPHTMPKVPNEVQMSPRQYPGVAPDPQGKPRPCSGKPCSMISTTGLNPQGGTGACACTPTKAYYSEKLEVGYRYYDAHKIAPAFVFGHGLSFSKFAYSGLEASRGLVSFTVTNSGAVKGTEVAQVYLGFPAAAGEPPKQLKGFKVLKDLAPGDKVTVTIPLNDRSFSIWDVGSHSWRVAKGEFDVWVGGSSDTSSALNGKITV